MNSQEQFQLEPIKLAVIINFLIFAGFSNWVALAYIHDFIGRCLIFFKKNRGGALGIGYTLF